MYFVYISESQCQFSLPIIFEAYFAKERRMSQFDIVLVQWAILARSCGSCAITRVAMQNECGGYCSLSNRCVMKCCPPIGIMCDGKQLR